jgi:maltose alpha-D-glucosyltransferase/alpha-amylase
MARRRRESLLENDPLWYKDAVIYEVHVRAFKDTKGDGMGDFRGLTARLDYLRDLGVTALWLLPFYPSPWRDDGYDIADYTDVHEAYGTVGDFRRFMRAAHRRGIRVIIELVINHTSDQHPWFQRARRAKPGSSYRNYYVWSDSPEKYRDARIIFKDFEPSNWTWDPVAKAYYWHRFYAQQPDLNYDHPQVQKAVLRAVDFWFRMGVDGMRLDAIPYLYEREGTNCENLPEGHAFLKQLRRHVDRTYPNRMLLAEANQWPEDAVAYFGHGRGDECQMGFHFPVMPRLFMAVQMEDRFPLIDILDQTPDIPELAQWALFLRNHDELTLEMVTDEERDYMYRVYAHDPQMRINLGIRRRLAPLLQNNRRKIELMNGLLMSMPGTPVLYYGDEIGMGDNIYLGDRDGVRTPMQWSGDRNAGFSAANPQKLYLPVITDPEYHYEAVNVEAQQNNPSSLLWWMKRLIALRSRHKAFGRGTIRFLQPENRKVLVFIREHEDERILVVANLSRFTQAVELGLSEYEGTIPVEMFGHTEFPRIGELPYFLTMGPHTFYWFMLTPAQRRGLRKVHKDGNGWPTLATPAAGWESLVRGRSRSQLEDVLPTFLRERRWFGGKARKIRQASIDDVVPLTMPGQRNGNGGEVPVYLTLVRVEYTEGDPEVYMLPLAQATGRHAERIMKEAPHTVVAHLTGRPSRSAAGAKGSGAASGAKAGDETKPIEPVLYDASVEPGFGSMLLGLMAGRRRTKGSRGALQGGLAKTYRTMRREEPKRLRPAPFRAEQSNTSMLFGDELFMKLFRKLEEGVNPDLEMGRVLVKRGFEHTPAPVGELEYRFGRRGAGTMTLAAVQRYMPNQGDAWQLTLDALSSYYERIAAHKPEPPDVVPGTGALLEDAATEPPDLFRELASAYPESARLLGVRTAEMHTTLASVVDNPDFAPEPFSALYQRSLYQSMRSLVGRVLNALNRSLPALPAPLQEEARSVLELRGAILERLQRLVGEKMTGSRIRTHGDYHLGQVLHTGRDFVIIDFEGEPARPLTERRLKRSPLSDVAGMLRSFHYVAHAALMSEEMRGLAHAGELNGTDRWAQYWARCTSAAFLGAYLANAGTGFLPTEPDQLEALLDAHLLEKAVYELGYELNNRPDWTRIPIRGIRHVLAV